MAKREIKCPHCNNWTVWKEALYDQCLSCNKYIKQDKINVLNVTAAQEKLDKEKEFASSANQNPYLRKAKGYAKTISIGFITVLMALIALAAG